MIKFNEYRAFFSKKERDDYNENSHLKKVVYFNPEHIIAIEEPTFESNTWPSSYNVTRIHTVRGYWLVEGNYNTIAEFISNSLR